ncbi:LysR family transcriptional regulator [Kutzneria sp. NPDC051319]|uniref:LysR family transcriptional regulator n=1 Tax=Kutzneria sp. NPDC051319 TaxID=3155047 RepID=UPI00343453FF
MFSSQELVALRSFLAVYRSGGVTRAAEQLQTSQPTISHHLRLAEAVAGRPLFTRSGRGIAPTEAGHALAADIAGVFDQLDTVIDARRDSASYAVPLALGSTPGQLDQLVGPLLAPLVAEGMTLQLRIGVSPELVAALLTDELDLAVVTKIEGAPRIQLHLRHWFDEDFVLVGPADEPDYDPESQRRFVGFSQEMPMARRYFRSCWGITPPAPAVTIADMRSVVTLVETGLLSVVPGFMARPAIAAGRIRVLHTPASPVLNPNYLACVRGRQNRPHIAAALERLLDGAPTGS